MATAGGPARSCAARRRRAAAGGGRDGGGKVNAALLGKIVASWVLTLPLAGGVAAALTVLFRAAITV